MGFRIKPPLAAWETNRERFMLAQCIAGCIHAANPPFCDFDGETPAEQDPAYIPNLADHVAQLIDHDRMATEDLVLILQKVIEICENR